MVLRMPTSHAAAKSVHSRTAWWRTFSPPARTGGTTGCAQRAPPEGGALAADGHSLEWAHVRGRSGGDGIFLCTRCGAFSELRRKAGPLRGACPGDFRSKAYRQQAARWEQGWHPCHDAEHRKLGLEARGAPPPAQLEAFWEWREVLPSETRGLQSCSWQPNTF